MEQVNAAVVGDLIAESFDTITPNESITVAKRRMESQTARSLIVVEDDRPVGVVQWRGLARHDGNALVRDAMLTQIPVLRADMPIPAVRDALRDVDVDLDHLPVVDDGGLLIGEVPRGLITKSEMATSAATEAVVSGPEQDRDVPTVHLENGMKVVGASGKNLGTVSQVNLNSEGRISHFLVKYGMLGRSHKRLPADVIRAVDGNEVRLTLDQMEFKMLADVGDEPA